MLLGYADIVATKLLNPNEDIGVIKTYMEYMYLQIIYISILKLKGYEKLNIK